MPDLFVDTSGWGHLADGSQVHHGKAAAHYRERRDQGDQFITTNYVLTEVVALLTRPLNVSRPSIIAFLESIKVASHIHVVHVNEELDRRAWKLLTERPDKNWSLVDCASFVVMRERDLTEALTTDHHFEQAGFVCLLP